MFPSEALNSIFCSHLNNTCSNKCNNNSNQVNCQLKLQELWDTVIDITPPHHSFHYASKVIVSKNDIRCFFGNICACNTLKRKQHKKFTKLSSESDLSYAEQNNIKINNNELGIKATRSSDGYNTVALQIKLLVLLHFLHDNNTGFLYWLERMKCQFWHK